MTDLFKNNDLPCMSPLLTTWGVKKEAGSWDIYFPSFDLNVTSIQEINHWYANTFKLTVEAFSSLLRMYQISFGSMSCGELPVQPMCFNWQPGESYEKHIENIYQAIEEYPIDISVVEIKIDIFAYVHTKESYPKPVRVWVREFGSSNLIGEMEICLSTDGEEPYVYFAMNHTLFYPFSYKGDDNSELSGLNKPLLEEALRNWEKKIGIEIEPDGLPGIDRYGFYTEN